MKADRLSAWLDASDKPPTEPGWYAVLWCFDPDEGYFPAGFYWDGERWYDGEKVRVPPVAMRSPQSFAEEEDATDWAREHDPEM